MKLYILLLPLFLIGCGEQTPNIPEGKLTLKWYKTTSDINRSELLKRTIAEKQWDTKDYPHYKNCMSDFAATQPEYFEFSVIIYKCHIEATDHRERFTQHVDELSDSVGDVFAVTACQRVIKQQLASPSRADFPFSDKQVAYKGRNRYVVESYVEAQNQFGAVIKNNWKCDIQYQGDSSGKSVLSNWKVHEVKIW